MPGVCPPSNPYPWDRLNSQCQILWERQAYSFSQRGLSLALGSQDREEVDARLNFLAPPTNPKLMGH